MMMICIDFVLDLCQRLVPSQRDQKVSELVASTLCNLSADNEQRAGEISEQGGVGALVRILYLK